MKPEFGIPYGMPVPPQEFIAKGGISRTLRLG